MLPYIESFVLIPNIGSAQGITPAPVGQAPGHQPSEENVDGLTAKPFWDIASDSVNFPWAAKLEENSHIIIKEFQEKMERDAEKSIFMGDSAWQNGVMGKGWSAFRLQRLGTWNVENCKEFPNTYELLRSLNIPIAIRGVCFARQGPGSGVQPHSDGRNFILTSHLGLSIPEGKLLHNINQHFYGSSLRNRFIWGLCFAGCWMKAGEEKRTWEEGKLTTLDTSFEHSTGNPTDSDRHVLIIDYWHPELTEAERAGLEYVYDLRNSFESGKVPFRKPKAAMKEDEGLGLGAILSSMFGSKSDKK